MRGLRAARLFDGERRMDDALVLIEDGRIVAVRSSGVETWKLWLAPRVAAMLPVNGTVCGPTQGCSTSWRIAL